MGDKRLYKSSENSMLCGVCGGIAEYFDIDPTLVRLAWVILTCFGGAGIWAYIIAAIIIPGALRGDTCCALFFCARSLLLPLPADILPAP